MQHVFLIGAKSISNYGGFETFVDKLTENHQYNNSIKYHIAVKANGRGASIPNGAIRTSQTTYTYHNADCFRIKIPAWIGSAQAVYYDCAALSKSIKIIKAENLKEPIVYIMTYRIGPFFNHYARQIRCLGGKVFLNPDGHEWMRSKWSNLVRKYWKYSERKMVLGSNLIVCDSANIEKYIQNTYGIKNTVFIAYGAETRKSICSEREYEEWLSGKELIKGEYYLIVGRLVLENNYETMIKEYMRSHTKKSLVIITDYNEKLIIKLEKRIGFSKDKRIKFVGTVYDQELLKKIREDAYAYIHGHEVGGTNPSLLEAMGSTKLNLLLRVGFNEEVGENAALYWTKEDGNLAKLIDDCEIVDREEIGHKAKTRIETAYSWKDISNKYEKLWLESIENGR